MGKVIRFRNISISINTHDHRPPHVHAKAKGAEAKIRIADGYVYWSRGFSKIALERICEEVIKNSEILMEVWDEIHGQ